MDLPWAPSHPHISNVRAMRRTVTIAQSVPNWTTYFSRWASGLQCFRKVLRAAGVVRSPLANRACLSLRREDRTADQNKVGSSLQTAVSILPQKAQYRSRSKTQELKLLSNSASAAEQVNDQDYQSHNQKQMDQASPDVHTETEKPQDQQNNENCPKHVNLLCSLASARM